MRIRSVLPSLFFLCFGICGDLAAQADPSVIGRWSSVPDLPFVPFHVHVLPTGKVMIFGAGFSANDARLWDPATASTTVLTPPGFDVFCSGHTFLADGRLFVAGGHIEIGVGLPKASIYDPVGDLWTPVLDMNAGRWYPTVTKLANGDLLVISGSIDQYWGENVLPQVFQVQSASWRDLTDAQIGLGGYPRMHLAPNGQVFNSDPTTATRYLDTSGTGAWSLLANRSVNVYRDYASSMMYEDGKILVVGGGDPPTNTAEVIDLNASTPAWRSVPSMAFARRNLNATLLPDGKVVATGGTSGPGFNNPDTPVFAAEMWDPATENWTMMASAQIPRLYHSAVVLLPDGRLLSTGGDDYTQTEIYEPPYLFKGTRPTITSAPGTVNSGQTFLVETPDATGITQVTWIALSSTTHAFNMNQRINRLSFSSVAGGLNVVAPANPYLAPAGYYMLFILNGNGVPSVAKIIRLNSSSSSVPTLSSLSPSIAKVGGPAITLTVNGSNFVAGSVVRWNGTARPTTFVSATQLTAAIPAADSAASGYAAVTVVNLGSGEISNALTFTIEPLLSASPTTIAPGATVTATWSHIANPTATDWIGLYALISNITVPIDWKFVNCSKTAGSALASGSCPFALPPTLAPGTYQLRLLSNNSYTLLVTSNVFTVTGSATLSVSPATIAPGGTVTATWSQIENPTAADWMGLYTPSAINTAPIDWKFVNCSKTAGSALVSGSCPFALPPTLASGAYQLRLFSNNGYALLATSNNFTNGTPAAGTLQFSSATYSVAENGGNAAITVTRTGGSVGAIGVSFATSNGTAAAASDYTAVSSTVSFADGDTANKTVTVPILDDNVIEGNETVNLTLSNPTGGATLGTPNTATLTIVDNEETPPVGTLQFSSATYSVAENGGNAAITVTRTGGSIGPAGVSFATSNGTAAAASDYTAVSSTVSFADGDTANKTVTVPILDDNVIEGNETVNLTLSNPTGGATLGTPRTATLTIVDNDETNITVEPASIAAGGTVTAIWNNILNPTATDWIALSTPSSANNVYHDWQYVSCTRTATTARASGSCPLTLSASLAPGTYELRLFAANGFTRLATGNVFTVTGELPVVTITASDLNATQAGLVPGVFTVRRTGSTASPLTVNYTVGGSATMGQDYMGLTNPGSAVIAAGQPSATIVVTPIDDDLVEGNETVTVTLSVNTLYVIGTPGSATVTIADNHPPAGPTLNASPSSTAAGATVSATWSGTTNPSSTDWIGLYAQSAPNTSYLEWLYVSCSKSAGIALASGSCNFSIPPGLANGAYELRLLSNNGYGLIATGDTITLGGQALPVVSIVTTANGAEPDISGSFSVSRTGSTAAGLTVFYTVGGSATGGLDYQLINDSVLIPDGQANASIAVNVIDDGNSEGNETITVTLNNNTNYTVGNPNSATVTITDDETPPAGPSVNATPGSVTRGNNVMVTWSGIPAPSATDWIGLYIVGSPNSPFWAWQYVSCTTTASVGRLSGSCAFPIPVNAPAGNFELRLFSNNGFNRLAASGPLMVQ